MISALSFSGEQNFAPLVDKCGAYIVHALSTKDGDLGRLACSLVSDLCTGIESEIEKYAADFLVHIVKIIQQPDFDKETKIAAIQAVGDLSMYSTQALTNNLESILQTALEAGAYSVSESASNLNDEEDRKYFFNLRKGVMECLTAVVAGISDCKMSKILDSKLDPLLEFLNNYFGNSGFNSNFVSISFLTYRRRT